MPPVKKIFDKKDLVPTKTFPKYAKFKFDEFNPVQSSVFDIYDKNCNAIIASSTGSGKTICAEMFMSHEVRKRGGKAIYLAPLKALAKEKIDEWTDKNHHFGDLKISICTGDFRLTPERRKELEAADIILLTSEMLNSRIRNFKSEQNEWLRQTGTLVADESHLLTVAGRGDHMEVGLMKFCQIVDKPRIVFLSATMPNVDEISDWVSYTLTGQETYLLESTYRPCPLGIHYEAYEGASSMSYELNEEQKVQAAIGILEDYPDDKFIVFVHTKRTGEMLKKELAKLNIKTQFHSADLNMADRHKLEADFKKGDLRVLTATSSLAWGINSPARRVIILGVHRGLAEVDVYDIKQMCGRAGRPGFDTRGDAYILLPKKEEEFNYHKERIQTPQKIESRLLDYIGKEDNPHYKTLAFHVISEIHHGSIKNKEGLHAWYERSLAHFQSNDLDDQIVDKTLDLLIKCGAVKIVDEEYQPTMVGKISSMFYYSPFDVADLKRNFSALFGGGYENNDITLAMALGNMDSVRMGIVSRAEREEMGSWASKIKGIFGAERFLDSAIKGGYVYFALLNGMDLKVFTSVARTYQADFPRLVTVLNALDTMNCKWNKKDYIRKTELRMMYGVRSDRVHLCELPDVGKVRAEKLWAAGIRSFEDVYKNVAKVKRVLNLKDDKVDGICNAARVKHLG